LNLRVHGGDVKNRQTGVKLANLVADGGKKLLRVTLRVDEEVCTRGIALRQGEICVKLRSLIEKKIFAGASEADDLNGRAIFLCAKRFANGILAGPDFLGKSVVYDGDFGSGSGVGVRKLAAFDDGSTYRTEIVGLDHVVESGFRF
jgi:hypothetical protein